MSNDVVKTRIKYIDIIKGIGIILVVIGHSAPPELLGKIIYGFHMPLFFILSGYLYDEKKWKEQGLKALIVKRFKNYIVPYFVLATINLILNMILESEIMSTRELIISTLKHAFWIVWSYGKSRYMPNCSPLWFLTCIFISNIYMYLVMKISSRMLRIGISILSIAINMFLANCGIIQLPWHIEVALTGTVFMLIGHLLRKHMNMIIDCFTPVYGTIILALGLIAVYYNGYVDLDTNKMGNPLLLFIGASMLSFLCIWISIQYIRNCPMLEFLGKNTMIIMGFNFFINTIVLRIWKMVPVLSGIEISWWINSILVLLISCMLIRCWDIIKNMKTKIVR